MSVSRQRSDGVRRRDEGQSKVSLRAHHPQIIDQSTNGNLQETSRLRDMIGQMQIEGRRSDKKEGLRWKIIQLEKDKLELSSKYNQEVSGYEAQFTRCRALLEKGEAQRQTLEYELAVMKRHAAAQKSHSDDKMADLITHNQNLEDLTAELRQRACDLQKALEITQQAHSDEEQSLQAKLSERDDLIHSISTDRELLQQENRCLNTLLQEQTNTLQGLKVRMVSMEREREREAEELRMRTAELRKSMEQEEIMKKEVEEAIERVKTLEQCVELDTAAHLEFKVNAEVVQLRLRDVEADLSVEKKNRAEITSNLELLKNKYSKMERAHTREKENAEHAQHTLILLQQEYQRTKSDLIGQLNLEKAESAKLIIQLDLEKAESAKLIGQLDLEKAASAKLIVRLQEQETMQMKTVQELNLVQKRLMFVEEAYDGLLKKMEQLIHHHQQGAAPISIMGDKRSPSTLMDRLKGVLHRYHTELVDLLKVVDTLKKGNKEKGDIITDQQRRIQECEAQCVCASKEAECLRMCVADAAERTQAELQNVTHHLEYEREQHILTKSLTHTLTQEYQREEQEKMLFLHSLYQRLIAGYVSVNTPKSMMGSFSWAELGAMLEEQADVLNSNINSANQRCVYLESVCEGKEAALRSVCEQLKQREDSWVKQREELDTHHIHLINQLHTRAQEVTRLQDLVSISRRDNVSLLAACAMLAGCLRALYGRVRALVCQKNLLHHRVRDTESLQQEVGALLHALDPGVRVLDGVRGGVCKFRVCVIAVLATLRLCTLCRNTHTLLRVAGGICVNELRLSDTNTKEEENDRVMKMLTSSQLCVTLHACMQEVQMELQRTESSLCVLAAARSSFSKLIEKLLSESFSGCHGDVGSLVQQLGFGLKKLHKTHQLPPRHINKVMVSALQQHFLVFTQRLHSAEVERRDLRIELSRFKRRTSPPHTKFENLCEELNSALRREQQAQTLLHEQATQLQEFGVTMEAHTSEQLEKDRTLAQAVQSLSDVKAELKKKDQWIQWLGKQLSQSQQEKQELQQSVSRTQNTLYLAARSKECLSSYIISVECRLRELKDQLLSNSTSSQDDFVLHLPTVYLDTQDLELSTGGAEMEACQALVRSFTDVYKLACNKMAGLAGGIVSYPSRHRSEG